MRQFSHRSIISRIVENGYSFSFVVAWLSACLWCVAADDSVASTAMSLHVPVWRSTRINDSNSSSYNGPQARTDAVETQVRCSAKRGAAAFVRGSDAPTCVGAVFFSALFSFASAKILSLSHSSS